MIGTADRNQAGGSRLILMGLIVGLCSILYKVFVLHLYQNAAFVDGLMTGSAMTDFGRVVLAFWLTAFDGIIIIVYALSQIHLFRFGEKSNSFIIRWLPRYAWFCAYIAMKMSVVAYYLIMQYPGTILTSDPYRGVGPLLNDIFLLAYLLVTGWLSQREPKYITHAGPTLLGPRLWRLLGKSSSQ